MRSTVFKAFLFREFRATLGNRLMLVFAPLALVLGLFPALSPQNAGGQQALLYLLQASLYLFPLFGILLGTGSAQNDQVESELLLAQPFPSAGRVGAKFCALWAVSGGILLLLFLPAAIAWRGFLTFLPLLGGSLMVLAVFLMLGLALGFRIRDSVKAHLLSLVVWLFLLVGIDLLAILLAYHPDISSLSHLWISLLMINPLDSLRIGLLFGIQAVPFDLDSIPPLARWWLQNALSWVGLLCFAWILGGFVLASRFSSRF